MLDDVERYLGAVERTIVSLKRDGIPLRAVTLSRTYETTVEDLWDALTNRERLPRWFAAVEGDLRLGGHYQVENNAGGKIVECEPPQKLSLTWETFGDVSWVDVVLEADGSKPARLTLTHTAKVSPHWEKYGPGAVGVGWELGFLGLAFYLSDPTIKWDEETFAASTEGKTYMRGSSEKWGSAAIDGGENAEKSRAAAARNAAFYTGEA